MFSVDTGQMSAVETGQMSAAETGQMSAVETRQMYSLKTGRRPVAIEDICLVSTADICPVAAADICPVSAADICSICGCLAIMAQPKTKVDKNHTVFVCLSSRPPIPFERGEAPRDAGGAGGRQPPCLTKTPVRNRTLSTSSVETG